MPDTIDWHSVTKFPSIIIEANKINNRLKAFTLTLATFALVYFIFSQSPVYEVFKNKTELKDWIEQFGYWGPTIIISLMTLAIVISPIPSAPIALTAGALYGHTTGTIYVIIGAETGAIIAFLTTRLSGIDTVNNWLNKSQLKYMSGSQNNLMSIVFISRLLPFISFDIVSYAAGLTQLSFWRFALATLTGIIPASFLLAHFGSQLTSSDNQNIGFTLLILAAISLIAILLKHFSQKK